MALVKLRLTTTVVFSSVMAYLIAASVINWTAVAVLALGGFMVTGAANALNQALEIDYDRLMKRTADRPMAAGRMTMSEGIIAAGFMSMIRHYSFSLIQSLGFFTGDAGLGDVCICIHALEADRTIGSDSGRGCRCPYR